MLATGGGLVFTGGTNDRKFHAFDASTGKLLWEFPTNSGILAPPHHLPSTVSNTSPYSPVGVEIRAECRRRSIVPFRASFRRFRRAAQCGFSLWIETRVENKKIAADYANYADGAQKTILKRPIRVIRVIRGYFFVFNPRSEIFGAITFAKR